MDPGMKSNSATAVEDAGIDSMPGGSLNGSVTGARASVCRGLTWVAAARGEDEAALRSSSSSSSTSSYSLESSRSPDAIDGDECRPLLSSLDLSSALGWRHLPPVCILVELGTRQQTAAVPGRPAPRQMVWQEPRVQSHPLTHTARRYETMSGVRGGPSLQILAQDQSTVAC